MASKPDTIIIERVGNGYLILTKIIRGAGTDGVPQPFEHRSVCKDGSALRAALDNWLAGEHPVPLSEVPTA